MAFLIYFAELLQITCRPHFWQLKILSSCKVENCLAYQGILSTACRRICTEPHLLFSADWSRLHTPHAILIDINVKARVSQSSNGPLAKNSKVLKYVVHLSDN